jgi:hypothetical protein
MPRRKLLARETCRNENNGARGNRVPATNRVGHDYLSPYSEARE